jgi:hypothetical protein
MLILPTYANTDLHVLILPSGLTNADTAHSTFTLKTLPTFLFLPVGKIISHFSLFHINVYNIYNGSHQTDIDCSVQTFIYC